MAEAPTTDVTADALEAAAGKLEDLFDDTSAFDNLEKFQDLQAGPDTFDSANWLESLVDDRLKGIQAHGDAMQVSILDLAEKLRKIATKFREADSANAEALQTGSLEIIDTWIGDTMDYTFAEAENTDVNFKGPDTKDVPRGDKFQLGPKGEAVYDENGNIRFQMPKAEGLDYDGQDPGGIFNEVNQKNGDGTKNEAVYNGGFLFDDKGDPENKEGARNRPEGFEIHVHKDSNLPTEIISD